MSSKFEVLLTNEATGQLWNTCLWDPATGSSLGTFKGCSTAPNTTAFLGDTYLISAQPSKPLLNVWQLNRREQRPVKQTTPGVVHALAASPNGHYIVLGIAEKIYLYQTCTGKLLNIIARHYQDVTHLGFTSDSSHFVSCGADGNTFVWSIIGSFLANKMPGESNEAISKPLHQWSHHGLAITGLAIGIGGVKGRIFTVSKDQTCKVYSVASGDLLLDVTFSVPLTSVAVDSSEKSVFVGSMSGPIYTFSLTTPPRDLKMTLVGDKKSNMLTGHSQEVTCLSVSLDGLMLASGSKDLDVRLWHVASRQCVRVILHKGPICTARFFTPPGSVFDTDSFKPSLVFAPFEKTVFPVSTGLDENFVVPIISHHDVESSESIDGQKIDRLSNVQSTINGSNNFEESLVSTDNFEINRLKEINFQLYQHAVKKLLK